MPAVRGKTLVPPFTHTLPLDALGHHSYIGLFVQYRPKSSSSQPFALLQLSSLLIPHIVQMLNDREIRIQEPIHTILRTSLLVLIKLSASNCPRDAFLPADIGEGVNSYFRD